MYTIFLESDKLKLRSLAYNELVNISTGDLERLSVIIEKEAVTENVKAAILKKLVKMYEVQDQLHPWYTYWLIINKENGNGIAFIGLKGIPDEKGFSEVGYSISENYRRFGFMTEALKLIVKWAEENPKCKAITATRVLKTNTGSNKVLLKCGFQMVSESEEENNYVYFIR